MNRVIEFRAWDGLRMTTSGIMFNTTTGCLGVPTEQSFTDNPINNNWVLMQFTGLHDKNGKKIFEGDILKSDTDNRLLAWKVMFKDGCFGIRNIGIDGSENYAEFHAINSPYYFSDRIIIGNIYECPQIK